MARTYAAALTPLRDGGAALDEQAFAPYVDFLHRGGVVGMLAMGTTGEGILLGGDERMRAAELFMDGPLEVIVNCGAQTTLATAELAAHAAERQGGGGGGGGPPALPLAARARAGGGRRGDPPAVLPARRARAARALHRRRACLRSGSLLRLRVRARERLPSAAVGDRAVARARAEPHRAQGLRHAVVRVSAVPVR